MSLIPLLWPDDCAIHYSSIAVAPMFDCRDGDKALGFEVHDLLSMQRIVMFLITF